MFKTQALARLKATRETAAALVGLKQLADKAADTARIGKKGPNWSTVLFKAKLKTAPTDEDLEDLGFIVLEDPNGSKDLKVEWSFSDGIPAVLLGDCTLEIEDSLVFESDDPKELTKYCKDLEKIVNTLLKKFG